MADIKILCYNKSMLFNTSIIKKLQKSNLIGRGCNNFLVADKWLSVKNAGIKGDKFVVCNVSESEPGMFKDEYVLKNFSERVIDGIKIAMKFIRAKKGFIYLNPEYFKDFQDYLLPEISAQKVNIELYEKPLHDYVGGEETSLLNSMQGLRVEPRFKPPFPTTHGFFNQPTIINNCETFYAVSLINSGEYKNIKFYCLSGDEVDNSVKELPVNITIKKCLQEFGHKSSDKYFYQVGGGAAGFCYNYKQLNRAFAGNPSIIIYKKNRPEKDLILHWLQFFKNESCGKCLPCREGTYRLLKLLEKQYAGENQDQAVINDLIFTIQNTSFCGLGKVACNAVVSYWKNICPKK
ncbi:hypothetical protein COX27_00505 [Candidatus Kuenenbacteria bacterium CG23_combo_of_CG06-09_8_20_14_all_36_9]|uniref:NADH-ubiquinone oxidoreductase 51kDa subunit iron-sulphur binding domain-containing protein n=1 Tax=Candidatus Kuenenbacteria bacterium CG10_big_fil_rev_8_21_14_0_10_36_11 TaxID=1974618 RepID=A0A2M6WAG5_9BACT|nr:MAG: hypothetical protein COX27_00505 [Candidatus Kuenenbacteria bacterium CG23_combo_of_CG06-09_8_20_14_all_36_9]PIT89796.1 MAG: hypothetical protein COU23_01995 [Candidatus Kuenenbacteria bacterium CG10_big_fil_rev_8_21_14_0_10_36_11]